MGSFEEDLAKACGPIRPKNILRAVEGRDPAESMDWRARFLKGIEDLDVESVHSALSRAPSGRVFRETMVALSPYASWMRAAGPAQKIQDMLFSLEARGLPLCSGNGDWMSEYLAGDRTRTRKFRRHQARRMGYDLALTMEPAHAAAVVALAKRWDSSEQESECRFQASDWIDEAFVWAGSSRASCEALNDEMAPMVEIMMDSLGNGLDEKQWSAAIDKAKTDGHVLAEGVWPGILAKALEYSCPRDGGAAASELARMAFMGDSVELLGSLSRAAVREGWTLGEPMAVRGHGFDSPYGGKSYEPVSWLHAASALLFEKKHWAEGGASGACMEALAKTPMAAQAALACEAPWAFGRASIEAMKAMCSAESGLFRQDAAFEKSLSEQDAQEWKAFKERHDLAQSLGAPVAKSTAKRI